MDIELRTLEKRKLSSEEAGHRRKELCDDYNDYIQTDRTCPLCGETVYPDGICDSCDTGYHEYNRRVKGE